MSGSDDSSSTLIWPPEPPFCDLGGDFTSPIWEGRHWSTYNSSQSSSRISTTPAVPNTHHHNVSRASTGLMPPTSAKDHTHPGLALPNGNTDPASQGFPARTQDLITQNGAGVSGSSFHNSANASFNSQPRTLNMAPYSDPKYSAIPHPSGQYRARGLDTSDAGAGGQPHSFPDYSMGNSVSANGSWTNLPSQYIDAAGYQPSTGPPGPPQAHFAAGQMYDGQKLTQTHLRALHHAPSHQASLPGFQFYPGDELRTKAPRSTHSSNVMRSTFSSGAPGTRESLRSCVTETSALRTPTAFHPYCNSVEDPTSSDNGSIPDDLQDIQFHDEIDYAPPKVDWFPGQTSVGQTRAPQTAVHSLHSPLSSAHDGPHANSAVPYIPRSPNTELHNRAMGPPHERDGSFSEPAKASERPGASLAAQATHNASAHLGSAGPSSALIIPMRFRADGTLSEKGNAGDSIFPQNLHQYVATGDGAQASSSNTPQNGNHVGPVSSEDQSQQDIRPPLIVCVIRPGAPSQNDSKSSTETSRPAVDQNGQSPLAAASVSKEQIAAASREFLQSVFGSALSSQHTAVLQGLDSCDGLSSAMKTLSSLLAHNDPFTVSGPQAQNPSPMNTHTIQSSNVPRSDMTPREYTVNNENQTAMELSHDSRPGREARTSQGVFVPRTHNSVLCAGPASETPVLTSVLSSYDGNNPELRRAP